LVLAAEGAAESAAGAGAGAGADPATQGQQTGSQLPGMLLMLGAFALIFWALIWRPESKRRKEREQLLNSVQKHDKVYTVGGVSGTVVEVDKDEVTLKVDAKKDVCIRFRRSAIDAIQRPGESSEEKK
jgi:preprotein translocase subunit YajC